MNKEVCIRCRNQTNFKWTDNDEVRWNKEEVIMCKGYKKTKTTEIDKECKHKVEQKLKRENKNITENLCIIPSTDNNKWVIEVREIDKWIMKESFKTRELARKKSREYKEVTRIRSRIC